MALFGGQSQVAKIIMQGAQALSATIQQTRRLNMEREQQDRIYSMRDEEIKLREKTLALNAEAQKIQMMNAQARMANAGLTAKKAEGEQDKVTYDSLQRAAAVRMGADDQETARVRKFAGYPSVSDLTDLRGKLLTTITQSDENLRMTGKDPEQDPTMRKYRLELGDIEAEIGGRSMFIQQTFGEHGNTEAVKEAEGAQKAQHEAALPPSPTTTAAAAGQLTNPDIVGRIKNKDPAGMEDLVSVLEKDPATAERTVQAYLAALPSPEFLADLKTALRARKAKRGK